MNFVARLIEKALPAPKPKGGRADAAPTQSAQEEVAALRALLDADELSIERAEAVVDGLEGERRVALLDEAPPETLHDFEDKLQAANWSVERVYAAREEIQKRLDAAEARAAEEREREAEVEHRRQYDAVAAKAEVMRQALQERYPALCIEIVELLRDLAAAQIEITAANQNLPAGCSPIRDPEQEARSLPPIREEELSRRELDARWFLQNTDIEVEAHRLQNIRGNTADFMQAGEVHCKVIRRRRFEVTRSGFSSAQFAGPLAAGVALPALLPGAAPYLDGFPPMATTKYLMQACEESLAADRSGRRKPAKSGQTVVELESEQDALAAQ